VQAIAHKVAIIVAQATALIQSPPLDVGVTGVTKVANSIKFG